MTRYHDASTGRFVSAEYAEAHPDTTAAVKGGTSGLRARAEKAEGEIRDAEFEASVYRADLLRERAEVDRLKGLLGRYACHVCEMEGSDSLVGVAGTADITQAEADEISEYELRFMTERTAS